ncbi:hypothetical protein HR060_10990 [Catenovulum sp. SM1970]|nr:hypothetical protein [Marinifaba aquimaris]
MNCDIELLNQKISQLNWLDKCWLYFKLDKKSKKNLKILLNSSVKKSTSKNLAYSEKITAVIEKVEKDDSALPAKFKQSISQYLEKNHD